MRGGNTMIRYRFSAPRNSLRGARATSFPKSVLHLDLRTFDELRKVQGTRKVMALVPLFDVGGKRDRDRNAGGKREKSNPFKAVKPEIAGGDRPFAGTANRLFSGLPIG